MDIYEFYEQSGINGIPAKEFKDIINGVHEHVYAKMVTGHLLLAGRDEKGGERLRKMPSRRVVKCVKEYYEKPGEAAPTTSNSMYLACDRVRRALGIDAARGDCRACHSLAMRLSEEGSIARKGLKIKNI